MAIIIDLFTRQIIAIDPIKKPVGDASEMEWTYKKVKNTIEARFGNELPKHFKKAMSKPQSVPYKYGDACDVIYKVKSIHFNKPYPVPCEVTSETCKRQDGTLILGADCFRGIDEPFPWSDRKYNVSLNFLKSLPNGTDLIVNTRTDLIATHDYVNELKRLNVVVSILYISTDEELNQTDEPGAPSYMRRAEAVQVLIKAGIKATLLSNSWYLLEKKSKQVS